MCPPPCPSGSQLHPDHQPHTQSIIAKLPLETLPHCPLDLIALGRRDSMFIFIVRINSASPFRGVFLSLIQKHFPSTKRKRDRGAKRKRKHPPCLQLWLVALLGLPSILFPAASLRPSFLSIIPGQLVTPAAPSAAQGALPQHPPAKVD